MTDIERDPVLQVFIDGRLLPNVTGCRVTRGFEQEFANAQVTLAGSAPAWVKQGSQVVVRMGGTVATAYQRFFGYVGPFGSQLWTPADTLECGDTLMFAKYFHPSEDVDLSNLTDEQIITRVFQEMGVPSTLIGSIGGTGKIFGEDPETPLVWPRVMTAAAVIDEVDQISLGWRTWVDAGGVVRRTEIIELPSDTPAYVFTEGVDIISGTATYELPEPNNEVTVLGDDVAYTVDDGGANTIAWHVNPFTLPAPMLQQETTSPTQLSAQEVAEWLLEHLNRNLVTVNLMTHRDELLSADMTVEVYAPHLRTHSLFWVQNVVSGIAAGTGQFRQELQLVSERSLEQLSDLEDGPIEPINPFDGAPLPLPPPPTLPPAVGTDVIVSFSLAPIDKEVVLIDGVETTLYTVQATDTTVPASAEVATRAWTASGPGAAPTSGANPEFTAAFTSLTGAEITLTITDTLGNTGEFSRPLDGGGGSPTKVKKLYAATSADWEVFDGATWRTYTPASAMLAIAPGPQAGAGSEALRTTDNLATPASTSTPFASGNVSAIWNEEDVNTTDVVAGQSAGSVAISTDGGATWSIVAGPGGEIRRIILSRFVANQIHVICGDSGGGDAGYYTSSDNGDSWTLQRAGDFVEIVLSHSRNVVVTAAGGLERAEEPGDPFTFPGSPTIVAAAAHIRQDAFYAWASDGSTYASDAPGSFAMEAREAIPDSGTPHVRSGDNDGEMVDMVYVAASSGAWKSIDGMRTADAYFKLRAGDHILIKHGITTDAPAPPTPAGRRLYAWGFDGVYKSTDDATTWTTIFTPSNLFSVNFFEVAGGQDIVVVYEQTGGADLVTVSTDGGATFGTVTAPRGGTPAAFDFILCISATNWIAFNSTEVYQTTNGGSSWSDVSGTYAGNLFSQASSAGGKIWSNQAADPTNTGTKLNIDGSGVATFSRGPYPTTSGAANIAISDTLALIAAGGGIVYPLLYLVTGTTPADITPSPSVDSWIAADSLDGSLIVALAISSGGGAGEIWRSTNGGSSWTQVQASDAALHCQFGYDQVVGVASTDATFWALVAASVGNPGTSWVSTDSGVTWTQAGMFPGSPIGLSAIRVFSA